MNGYIYSHDPSNECYTCDDPVYRNNYSSNSILNTPKIYFRHSYSPCNQENLSSSQIKQTNSVNQQYLCMDNFQPKQRLNIKKYNFENTISSSSSSSKAYYDRIHSQVRSNISVPSPILESSTPSRTPIIDDFPLNLLGNDGDLPLDYPHYTIDSLIQRLVPSVTYIPKQSFIYPMLMCSRTHIRPSLLLNKLAYFTMNSIKYSTRDQSIRIMRNFLYVLSQWTRTFPYDFRNTEITTQLDGILRKLNSYEPSIQSDIDYLRKKLNSKLKALENYEEYIRQLNKKALNKFNHTTLFTDIINECPTSLLFAQQLTYIELDRLKPIGAEEFIQYFIMKLASEEARAHPNRTNTNETIASNNDILDAVHDTKLTHCLETYIQWFNRLTFFITTEIVKHTQRRLRIRLINYFIDTAYECLRLQNFNSMIGIIGGLNMQPVKRLKKTWEKIQLNRFQQLENYTNVSKNFSNYRHIFKTAMDDARTHNWKTDKIVIPFTSIIVQDVYYIKTHSKDYTIEGGINLKKYYSIANFISEEFVQCKQSKCSFERNDVIINYIITSPTYNEDSLMLASFECEPPKTQNEKEKWTILQTSVNKS